MYKNCPSPNKVIFSWNIRQIEKYTLFFYDVTLFYFYKIHKKSD